MTRPSANDPSERFEPQAAGAMARMFDDVTPRYDLLNRLMTAGQDGSWRAAMWRAIPPSAARVLDLCTGNGVSLPGLQRPGRLVLGMDVSLGMLERAAATLPDLGWAPRLVCADAFRLPLADGSLDAITIAFGMRNLRPHDAALAEIRRVLAPGGTLAVLEATAPGKGPASGFHAFHLRHMVPLLGRLSSDPSAYRYLSQSIFEFGDGTAFERELAAAGFEIRASRSFLFGATRLWEARRVAGGRRSEGTAGSGENPTARPSALQIARGRGESHGETPQVEASWEREWRIWTAAQALISAALTAALLWGILQFAKSSPDLPLDSFQRRGLWVLLVGGAVGFLARTVLLGLRLTGPALRR